MKQTVELDGLEFEKISPTDFQRGALRVWLVDAHWLAAAPGCSAMGAHPEAAIEKLRGRVKRAEALLRFRTLAVRDPGGEAA
jgi:hypothetical protein